MPQTNFLVKSILILIIGEDRLRKGYMIPADFTKNIIEGNKIKNKEALANPDSLKQFINIKELKY